MIEKKGKLGSWFLQLPAVVITIVLMSILVFQAKPLQAAAPPSVQQLWQCDPPATWDPITYTCVGGWTTGNNDGPYSEGMSIPYRTRMQNLVAGNEYSITIGWDTTKAGKHAIDYLTSYNETVINADACAGLTGLPVGLCDTANIFSIPEDTFMTDDLDFSGSQLPGLFTIFGGSITNTSMYNTPINYIGDTATSITIYFTANSTDMVLAWGGHIAQRLDWGIDNSAVSITGAPYHMHIDDAYDVTNDTKVSAGEMDRSLSSEAVVYPALIKIIKEATPESLTEFSFAGSLGEFTLVDSSIPPNYLDFAITTFGTYTITETVPAGWSLDSISCMEMSDPLNLSNEISTTPPSAVLNLQEGAVYECTFNNSALFADISVVKTDYDYGDPIYTNLPWPGGSFYYTITVTNHSNLNTALDVVVTDYLDINVAPIILDEPLTTETEIDATINPADSRYCTWVDDATPDGYGGMVTCQMGDMAPGEVATITFQVNIDMDTPMDSLIELRTCTQDPNMGVDYMATPGPVDICNIVGVTSMYDDNPDNNSDSDPHDIGSPTSVTLLGEFTAEPLVKAVKLQWETASETDHAYFNLYRDKNIKGERKELIASFIIGLTPGSSEGFSYEYTDEDLTPRPYFYWLESVDAWGGSEWFGPVSAQAFPNQKVMDKAK